MLDVQYRYTSLGEKLIFCEQFNAQALYTCSVSVGELYPVAGMKKNVFCIIGVFGNYPSKKAERRFKNDGVQLEVGVSILCC